jgi:hypothetical protein
MNLDNSILLLHDARSTLSEINEIYQNALINKNIPPILSLRIKRFLDEVRSSLDYVAFEIFKTFCSHNIPESQLNRISKKIYFPIRTNPDSFDEYVSKCFVGLNNSNPEIVQVIRSYQPFDGKPKTFYYLNELSNENKHRNFTVKKLKRNQQSVVQAKNGFTIIMHNSHIPSGSLIINNEPLIMGENQIPINQGNLKSVDNYEWTSVDFESLNIEVLNTLISIFNDTNGMLQKLMTVLSD